MKVGTDGVLLGAWASQFCHNAQDILDIGSGSGVIALMLAQSSKAFIDAVEIDQAAATQAAENFQASLWRNRMQIHCMAVQQYAPQKHYQIIVSNPPYFIESLKSATRERSMARHTEALPYTDLITALLRLLDNDGTFFAIFPYEQGNIFIAAAALKGLYCHERIDIRGVAGKPIKRVMLRLRQDKPLSPQQKELVIEAGERHQYTPAYVDLTKEFYLYF